MPKSPVLRLLFINWTLGVLLGCVFASAVIWFNIAGLYRLLSSSDSAVVAIALLYGGFSITFGSVVCGSAVMHAAGRDDRDHDDGDGLGAHAEAVPVPVRIPRR